MRCFIYSLMVVSMLRGVLMLRIIKSLALGIAIGLVSVGTVMQFTSMHTNYLMNKVGSQVVQLSPPSTHLSGGTGFAVRLPSGLVGTLTNAHVCRMADNGFLHALVDASDRYVTLQVVEISNQYDLCLLTALPSYDGLTVAGDFAHNDEVAVIGHPRLEALTMQIGNATNQSDIQILIGMNWTQEQCEAAKAEYIDMSGDPMSSYFRIKSYCVKRYFDVVRITARIFPGNSGSPVVNFIGNVVGVVFAGDSETNWGFIVPLKQVQDFISRY